jgi:hypothetical protein
MEEQRLGEKKEVWGQESTGYRSLVEAVTLGHHGLDVRNSNSNSHDMHAFLKCIT